MIELDAVSLAPYQRGLTVLTGLIEKATTHAETHKIEAQALLSARLYPDMLPLSRQVQIASDHAERGTSRLLGLEPPRHDDTEQSFAELQQRIASAAAFVASHGREVFAGREEQIIELKLRDEQPRLKAVDYLMWFSLPNFYFHITTAYDILRHNGVPFGKRDYLGPMPERAP